MIFVLTFHMKKTPQDHIKRLILANISKTFPRNKCALRQNYLWDILFRNIITMFFHASDICLTNNIEGEGNF